MHPYSYNRLRLDTQLQNQHGSENADPPAGGGAPENKNTDGAGSSPDLAQLMAMMEAMRGGKTDGAGAGLPPDFMKLMTMMQAMLGGASGGNGMQSILPLLSTLGGGGGLPSNMKSVLESASGGSNSSNGNNSMLNLLQGMMPPQTAQLFNMLSSFRS